MYKNPNIRSNLIINHDHNLRNPSLSRPYQRLTLTQCQSVAYQGPTTWNMIPLDVRNRQSLSAFKYTQYSILLEEMHILQYSN